MEKDKLEIEQTEYKGHPVISIWELDDKGERKGRFPIVTLGRKKARALVAAMDELKTFAEAEK